MMPSFLLKLSLAAVTIGLGATWLSTRVVQPALWRWTALRRSLLAVFVALGVGLLVWLVAQKTHQVPRVHGLAEIVYAAAQFSLPVTLATLLGALADRAFAFSRARERPSPPTSDTADKVTRRAMLCFGGATVPTALVTSSGLSSANRDAEVRTVRMRFAGLHPDLVGFKILQLSDLHLGVLLGLDDLRRGLERAMEHSPDLIVVTGDLANDPALLAPALDLIARAGAPFGAIAILGNHEHLVGIDVTRPIFDASAVPLLVGEAQMLDVGGARLHVGGADDPIEHGPDFERRLRRSIRDSWSATAADADLRLLLCHRPEGFVPASELGYELTLAGHTHGGQLGWMGRSVLEWLRPEGLWWGAYVRPSKGRRRTPRLYTTSGFGHWFPFRFGCPTEMPLLVLEPDPPTTESGRHVSARSAGPVGPHVRK